MRHKVPGGYTLAHVPFRTGPGDASIKALDDAKVKIITVITSGLVLLVPLGNAYGPGAGRLLASLGVNLSQAGGTVVIDPQVPAPNGQMQHLSSLFGKTVLIDYVRTGLRGTGVLDRAPDWWKEQQGRLVAA